MIVSGPMFEPARVGPWKSSHNKAGAHYNIYGCNAENGMAALRDFFPQGAANEMNFVLFSTSGVHGTYSTIEDEERDWRRGVDEDGEPARPEVTFLVVQPRIVCLRYGTCEPQTADDFKFLKRLRASSLVAVSKIGIAQP